MIGADVSSAGKGAAPSLHHLFVRTAEAFGISEPQMRGRGGGAHHEARLAFCWLASRVAGCASQLSIGMKVARDAGWVDAAIWEAGARADKERAFAEKLQAIEIECLAEAGVAARIVFPLPHTSAPREVAERLASSPREAMAVGVADLAALGAAYLALADEIDELRASFQPLLNKDINHGQVA